jgi:3-isopropylmalate/(R)-2-methylmalate dehydratase small subunit
VTCGWLCRVQGGRQPSPDFVLNQKAYEGTTILLSGSNFGCGSSREHAVWVLKEYGIRAAIAQGFGSIFAGNCIGNGLLPLVLPAQSIAEIATCAAPHAASLVVLNLA